MAAHKKPGETSSDTVQFSPAVDQLREFLHSNPSDGWDRCWEEGVTPWDLGKPTPALQRLLQTNFLPMGRALVPGCGSGYDVVAMAAPGRYVIGLDSSEVAIKKARELASASPNAKYISFLQADFFTWEPTQLFDLIFDYTFFCAIVPNMRSAWATRMGDLLKPDGELITLMFPIDDHDGGPPYKTSVAEEGRSLGGGDGRLVSLRFDNGQRLCKIYIGAPAAPTCVLEDLIMFGSLDVYDGQIRVISSNKFHNLVEIVSDQAR